MINVSLRKLKCFFDEKGDVLRMPGYDDHIPFKILK